MTERTHPGNVKYMSRFTFAALASFVLSSAAGAQQVPGRDLFEFPIGLLAEAPPLSGLMAAGLWNPATTALPSPDRGNIGFAGLTTPTEQGVDLSMFGSSYRTRRGLSLSLSYAQASVRDIFRTDTDPQTIGSELPYQTTLLSLGAAGTRGPVTFGAAARLRSAHFEADHQSVGSIDAGVIVDRIAGTPLRVAASTFLFSPDRSRESATYSAAADVPIVKRDSTFLLRGGYSISHTEGLGREHYVFASSTYRRLIDANAGLAENDVFGHTGQRLRLGVGLRYAGYLVAFGREDGAGGIRASYQILITRVFR